MALIMPILKTINTVAGMEEFVLKIGPSATSAVAQMRLSRAIQCSSSSDPHLVLIGLVRYAQVLGTRLLPCAKTPMFEVLLIPSLRYVLANLLSSWNIKFEASDLRTTVWKLGDDFKLDPYHVLNILDYADICISLKKERDAKRLIIRSMVDADYNDLRLREVIRHFIQTFGRDHIDPTIANLGLPK